MNRAYNPYMIILFGPTAVGKTELALALASEISAEIVNMDVGQLYTPLSIGTAKPPWKTSSVLHHLFDVINEPKNCTVAEYRDLLIGTLHTIWARGNVPLLVGGSAFYLRSVLFPVQTIISSPVITESIDAT